MEVKLVDGSSKDFPSINQLAKDTGISASKLKTLFKKVYGKAIYEYYQEQRMLKAKALLLSGKFSIKETAMEMVLKTSATLHWLLKNNSATCQQIL